jgi:hypothetical protein
MRTVPSASKSLISHYFHVRRGTPANSGHLPRPTWSARRKLEGRASNSASVSVAQIWRQFYSRGCIEQLPAGTREEEKDPRAGRCARSPKGSTPPEGSSRFFDPERRASRLREAECGALVSPITGNALK